MLGDGPVGRWEMLHWSRWLPRTRPDVPRVRPSPEDEAELRKAIEALDRGEGTDLTPEELRHWAETGEWPERLG
jgi:hypothetical protein